MRRLNALSGEVMTLFAIDDANHVRGTVTDGDVRRALISGAAMDTPVAEIMHLDFKAVAHDRPDIMQIRRCRDQGIRLLPRLKADGTLAGILDLTSQTTVLPLSAILMAGGKGERLRPMTLTTPKPLLQIGGKAIIDYNIEALARCGISDIWVTTCYMADQLSDHFSTPVAGVQVKCVEEKSPLGTIGSASLAGIPDRGFTIVMNSDLLTSISFEDMYIHHLDTGADITIAAIPYQVSVPYAILSTSDTDSRSVTGIEEKPSYSFFANAGIYIFPNELLHSLPTDYRTDATDLIERAISRNMKVTYFPINGTWIDVGSPTDFRQATELMKYVNKMLHS